MKINIKKLRKVYLLKILSSLKITVYCLLWLFVLTLWGTIAQVNSGLYMAQEKFFFSWGFLAGGVIPLPGARMILWVMFINLLCVSITRFKYLKANLGILIIHLGMLTYFLSAFVLFHVVEESNLTLLEGKGSNLSSAYHQWEVSVFDANHLDKRVVHAVDVKNLFKKKVIKIDPFGIKLVLKEYYPNAIAYINTNDNQPPLTINQQNIVSFKPKSLEKEPEKNVPSIIVDVLQNNTVLKTLLLYGGETSPTNISINGKLISIQLRHKRYELPFLIYLNDFIMEKHPGTQMARSYSSEVKIEHNGLVRDQLIYMNHPLRYKNYTLYQASYSIDEMGRERSTLAVVKNSGQWLPYIASFIVLSGLVYHFLMMSFRSKKKKLKTN